MEGIIDSLWGIWGLLLFVFTVAFLGGLFWTILTRGSTKVGWVLV